MALTQAQQIKEAINKSQHILITFKKDFSVDAVASAVALFLVLQKMGKLVDITCDNFRAPHTLSFLPTTEKITPKLSQVQKFVISINDSDKKIDEFSYSVDNGQLNIFIVPKTGAFSSDDIITEKSTYKYDLIFTVDTPDFGSLGAVFSGYTQFFYDTPIVNIDHHPENEQYGQINVTDINAVATSEIMYQLLKALDDSFIDEQTATSLLTGIISKTKSFKTAAVTPTTLHMASDLMNHGADKNTIIKYLYRSKTLATFNIWGRFLARLKSENGNKLVWSLLTEHDFLEAKASQADLAEVIDELVSFIPGVEIVVLFYQLNGNVNVMIKALKNHNVLYLTKDFKSDGTKQLAHFSLTGKTLSETEKEVIGTIQRKLGESDNA